MYKCDFFPFSECLRDLLRSLFVLRVRRARVETLNGAELCLEPAKGISMALRCTVIPAMCAGGHWGIMGRGDIIIKNKSIIY